MQENKKFKIVSSKKTRYILPNIITLCSVCLGISSIKFSLDQNFHSAVIFILIASILDALDGRIARMIKGTSEFGKELDSLTDFVSFGIAPAFILYFWELNSYGKLGWALILIYSVCCVLRLARFNLTNFNDTDEWKKNFFEGVPSPIGALLILSPIVLELANLNLKFNLRTFAPYLILIVSFLLISKIPTFSLKKITIPRQFTIFVLLFIGLSIVSLVFYTYETLLLVQILYVLSLPFSFLIYFKKKKKINEKEHPDEHEDVL